MFLHKLLLLSYLPWTHKANDFPLQHIWASWKLAVFSLSRELQRVPCFLPKLCVSDPSLGVTCPVSLKHRPLVLCFAHPSLCCIHHHLLAFLIGHLGCGASALVSHSWAFCRGFGVGWLGGGVVTAILLGGSCCWISFVWCLVFSPPKKTPCPIFLTIMLICKSWSCQKSSS